MGNNCKDCSNTGIKSFASMVEYEGVISSCNPLKNDPCVNVEEMIEQHDKDICEIKADDIVTLDCDGIDYIKDVQGKTRLKDAIIKHSELWCDRINNESAVGLSEKEVLGKLNFKCLQKLDACANPIPIDTYVKLFQAIIDELCP